MTEQAEKYQGFWTSRDTDFQRARGNIDGTAPLRTLAQARKDAAECMTMKDLKPESCLKCLGHGQTGMDGCPKCDGVGSVFTVAGETFPNTKAGYGKAIMHKQEREQ